MSVQNKQICIASKYLGAKWAGKILKDWGCEIVETVSEKTHIVVADQREKGVQHQNVVVLTDVSIRSEHLLALSGNLVTFGQKAEMFFPNFLVETVAANGIAIKCLQKLLDKSASIERLSILDLVKYFGAFNVSAKENGMISSKRGENILEGGAPYYAVYTCKEGHLAVGNLEPKFYQEMIRGLNLTEEEREFCAGSQFAMDEWPRLKQILTKKFAQKTALEWENHYTSFDTCITEIKSPFVSTVREPKIYPLAKPKL